METQVDLLRKKGNSLTHGIQGQIKRAVGTGEGKKVPVDSFTDAHWVLNPGLLILYAVL